MKSSSKTQTLILQGIHEKYLSENPNGIFKNYYFYQTSLKREFTVRALSTLSDKLAKVLGLDRFFSSLFSKPVPGLSFFALSLVSVEKRHSFPIQIEQLIKSDVEKNNVSPSLEVKR